MKLAEQVLNKKEISEGKLKKKMWDFLMTEIKEGDDTADIVDGWKQYWNHWAKQNELKDQDPETLKAIKEMNKAMDKLVDRLG